ncbi:MAG TPA: thioredoxin family protein, partial [Dehalococcoidia bacterium]|nr:thioredoxin family protein [Dehalococcoidia bacterium]
AMTQQQESVVTPERLESGLTWQQYFADKVIRNRDKFQFNYDETRISDEDAAALRALVALPNGPARVLVLGEDWCPDVFRGLPVLVRIAEAAGMELRVFPRDDNLDIMKEFLKDGEHQSIPTAVFYTRDHRYICHWIERPAKANAEMGEMQKLFEGLDREKDRDLMRDRYNEFQTGPTWSSWREATVKEIRALLEEKSR